MTGGYMRVLYAHQPCPASGPASGFTSLRTLPLPQGGMEGGYPGGSQCPTHTGWGAPSCHSVRALPIHPWARVRPSPGIWEPQATTAGLGDRENWGALVHREGTRTSEGDACTSARPHCSRCPVPHLARTARTGKCSGCHGSFPRRISSLALFVKDDAYIRVVKTH